MRSVRILVALFAVFLIAAPAVLAQVKPPQPVPVPNVTGHKIGEAQQILHQQGFKTALKLKPVEDSRQAALVFEQNPRPGTTALPAQTTVTLTVGDYQVQPRVPGVTGMPLDKAQQAMASAGFNAVVTMETVTDKSKDNVVLRQQVPGGAMLAKGSKVPVVVGRYTAPAQVKVPYVTGKPLTEAQKILADNKLNAQVTMQPVAEPQRNGVVIGQKVAVGTPLAPGSMVPVIVGQYTPPARANVPNVTGKPLAEAQKILADNKLNAQVTMQPVAQPQQNGVVLSQTLSVGTPVAPGSMVPIIVGTYAAPAKASVPDVTGKPLAEAQKALAANKLNAVVSWETITDPAKNNIVLKQQAAPGTQLAPGSQVALTAGKFNAPAAQPVPIVKGMPGGPAMQRLQSQGWKVDVQRKAVTDAKQHNLVLQQSPEAGAQAVPAQQVVTLVIGQYHETVRVPSIVGMTGKQAEAALAQAKLKINAGAKTVQDRTKIGTVLDQNPAPGTAVEPGSQVIVTMGLDPKAKIEGPRNNPYYPYNPPIPSDGVNTGK